MNLLMQSRVACRFLCNRVICAPALSVLMSSANCVTSAGLLSFLCGPMHLVGSCSRCSGVGMYAKKMMNRSAERHEPCGTPMRMSMVPDRMLLMMNCVDLFLRNDAMNLISLAGKCLVMSMWRRMLC